MTKQINDELRREATRQCDEEGVHETLALWRALVDKKIVTPDEMNKYMTEARQVVINTLLLVVSDTPALGALQAASKTIANMSAFIKDGTIPESPKEP
jgi:hypothetical protein